MSTTKRGFTCEFTLVTQKIRLKSNNLFKNIDKAKNICYNAYWKKRITDKTAQKSEKR